jgi:uronate dehydrogenase
VDAPQQPLNIQHVLITGGCGRIGSYFAKSNAGRYRFRMVDRIAWDGARHGDYPGQTMVADLTDLDACRQACQGMDAVIHLAADPDPAAEMDSLLPNNIISTYNMFTAALQAGCRRFLFASSVHAIEGYPPDTTVEPEMPIFPKNLYGVTKCFGEALGIYFGHTKALPTVALRIGAYQHPQTASPLSERDKRTFIHPDDLNQLLVKCLEAPDVQFAIVHAASDNRYKRLDISAAMRDFGYQPHADAFEIFATGTLPHESPTQEL